MNFEKAGILKEVDKQGRVVIPKEARDTLDLNGVVEVVITSKGVLIRSPRFVLVKKA